jgi:hypothetical protein
LSPARRSKQPIGCRRVASRCAGPSRQRQRAEPETVEPIEEASQYLPRVQLPDDARVVGVATAPLSQRELQDEQDLADIAAILSKVRAQRAAVIAALLHKFER